MTVHVLQHLRGTDDDRFCFLSIAKVPFQERLYEAPMMESGGNSGVTAESLTAITCSRLPLAVPFWGGTVMPGIPKL